MKSNLLKSALLTCGALVAIGAAGVASAAAADAADAGSGGATALQEVIVTSTKRSVNLQKAPVAITAVSGEALAADHIINVRDLSDSQPGLSFSQSDAFDQQIAIRGIVTIHLADATAEPSVATFVDGVYIGGQGTTLLKFYDVDHVEITRGPQGVLLGKNVAGGAISVTNNAPSETTSGTLDVGYGNYNSFLSSGYITGALSPTLFGRLAFQWGSSAGWTRDILLNRNMDGYQSQQVRGELLWRPDANFQAQLTVELAHQRTSGLGRTAVQDPFSASPGAQTTYEAQHGYGDRENVDPNTDFTRQRSVSSTLRMDWKPVEGIKVTSVSNVTVGGAEELFQQLQAPSPPLLLDSSVAKRFSPHEYSEDLRIASDNSGRLDYILGGYAYHNTESTDFDNIASQDPADCAAYGGFLCGHSFYYEHLNNDVDAVYGQAGYKITPSLRVYAGVRWLADLKSGFRGAYCYDTGQPLCSTPLGIAPGTGYKAPFTLHDYATTPQAGVSYQVTSGSMVYFSYSRGYKGGGYDENPLNATTALISFRPESANSYEIGLKNEFFDHRLRANIALFYLQYDDLQVEEINQVCLCLVTQNAASAISKGVEVETQFQAAEGIRFFANGAYVNAHYITFLDAGVDDSGHQLPFSPKLKGTIGVHLAPDLGGQIGRSIDITADYTLQSKFYFDPSQMDAQKGFGVLNASITYRPPNAPWSVSLWGRNLTNRTYATYGQSFVGDIQETLAPPLTFGGTLHYDFR
jgi:iron complex outermembrane receptor protein